MQSYSHVNATCVLPSWAELLHAAVNQPGIVSQAFSRFHNYSLGNQLLAMVQCQQRGIQPGPIATFMRWKQLGRHVRKGEKAITLCMPVTCKGSKTVERQQEGGTETQEWEFSFTRFVYRPNWFVLAQTEGAEFVPEPIAEWDETRALETLKVERIPFTMVDGNTQGYARGRQIALNPLADQPAATLFHELGHIVLGHTAEGTVNGATRTPKEIRELEAECVALLCCETLGLPGAELSRGYIQSWYKEREIPERSAQRILHAADEILRAGRAAQ
jgi:antirestriction protein ArdC